MLIIIWLVVSTPLKNMSSSVGTKNFPIYGKPKNSCSKPPTSWCLRSHWNHRAFWVGSNTAGWITGVIDDHQVDVHRTKPVGQCQKPGKKHIVCNLAGGFNPSEKYYPVGIIIPKICFFLSSKQPTSNSCLMGIPWMDYDNQGNLNTCNHQPTIILSMISSYLWWPKQINKYIYIYALKINPHSIANHLFSLKLFSS